MPFKRGDYFSQDQLLRLQQSLNGADYFSVVNVVPNVDKASDGVVDITVQLAPAKRTIYTGGPFIGTDTGFGVRVGLERRWVNRRGHKWKNEMVAAQRLKTVSTQYSMPMPGDNQRSFNFGANFRDSDTDTLAVAHVRTGRQRDPPMARLDPHHRRACACPAPSPWASAATNRTTRPASSTAAARRCSAKCR